MGKLRDAMGGCRGRAARQAGRSPPLAHAASWFLAAAAAAPPAAGPAVCCRDAGWGGGNTTLFFPPGGNPGAWPEGANQWQGVTCDLMQMAWTISSECMRCKGPVGTLCGVAPVAPPAG